ncbi:DUF72 domain-containing protein [Kineosporia babensis]|uniref:DUF72 domain-containing protein n=1 Tax=Kineosporia babensis TaxID=499548 RepID=A0A9X1SVE3_9ACTN|nr:DUF72 domain-containing protein [Kineosporia babensis]MCD5313586.1 DUF72 domain-containing protein [Kineosporia babensis]
MWTHKSWSGRISPKSADAGQRLRHYAQWCNAVEGNTTFYAVPSQATVQTWAEQTPESFRFAVKLPRTITHDRRLNHVDAELRAFLEVIEPLGPRLEPLWVQLPNSFGPGDLTALYDFLKKLPPQQRCAVEVRHPAFFTDPAETQRLERLCARVGAEWVPFDTTAFFEKPPTSDAEREAWERKPRLPRRSAALTDRPTVRYLGRDDEAATVAGWQYWVEVVAAWLQEGRSPTFFLHTPDNVDAPRLARRFHEEVRVHVPGLKPLPEPEPIEPATLF